MGKVIVFVNTKGGVGKSFLAVHLAVWLADAGYQVAALDCDDQKTSAKWLSGIDEHAITVRAVQAAEENQRSDEVRREINNLVLEKDFVVVDTQGSAGLTTSAAVIKSDLAIVPLQPSASDIWPIEDALSIIRLSQEVRQGLPAASLILNQTEDADVLARDVRRLAQKFGIPIAQTNVKRLHAYRDAPGNRNVATRLTNARGRKAGARLTALFSELLAEHLRSQGSELANG